MVSVSGDARAALVRVAESVRVLEPPVNGDEIVALTTRRPDCPPLTCPLVAVVDELTLNVRVWPAVVTALAAAPFNVALVNVTPAGCWRSAPTSCWSARVREADRVGQRVTGRGDQLVDLRIERRVGGRGDAEVGLRVAQGAAHGAAVIERRVRRVGVARLDRVAPRMRWPLVSVPDNATVKVNAWTVELPLKFWLPLPSSVVAPGGRVVVVDVPRSPPSCRARTPAGTSWY